MGLQRKPAVLSCSDCGMKAVCDREQHFGINALISMFLKKKKISMFFGQIHELYNYGEAMDTDFEVYTTNCNVM